MPNPSLRGVTQVDDGSGILESLIITVPLGHYSNVSGASDGA